MKKIFSMFLAVLTIITTMAVPVISSPTVVMAATSWPSVSASSYVEFTAQKTINVFKDSSCKTRGTSSPSKAYNAYIEKNDVVYIYKITSNYLQVNYPTSSGRRTGFARCKDVFGVSAPLEQVTSSGKGTTYKWPGSTSYGYIENKDKVWALRTSGDYTAIIYTAKSNKRAYKYGFILTSVYNKRCKGKTTTTKTSSNGKLYNPALPLPNTKGLSSAEALARVAESQIGYQGLGANGNGKGDYTVYASVLNHKNGQQWCATFVSFCVLKASISKSKVPTTAHCKTMYSNSSSRRAWSEANARKLKRGDVVFFSNSAGKLGDKGHTGIVTKVTISGNIITVQTVEGNTSSDQVKRCTYKCNIKTGYYGGYWKYIGGFISL